jgi:hypothetical protein
LHCIVKDIYRAWSIIHIYLKYHYLREKVASSEIEFAICNKSTQMLSQNLFTNWIHQVCVERKGLTTPHPKAWSGLLFKVRVLMIDIHLGLTWTCHTLSYSWVVSGTLKGIFYVLTFTHNCNIQSTVLVITLCMLVIHNILLGHIPIWSTWGLLASSFLRTLRMRMIDPKPIARLEDLNGE